MNASFHLIRGLIRGSLRGFTRAAVAAAALGGAGSLAAQQIYYVDPANGDDTNNGLSATQGSGQVGPFRTLTHALDPAATSIQKGDTIELLPTGKFAPSSNGEVFPLVPLDDVDIVYPGSGQAAEIDGEGAAVVFRADNDLPSSLTTLRGFRVTRCGTALEIPAGTSTKLLVVENCAFDGFTSAALRANYTESGAQGLVVRDCTVTADAAGAAHGVRITVNGPGVQLAASLIEDCTINNCDTGIAVEARSGAAVLGSSQARRNTVQGFKVAGIQVLAQAGTSGGDTANSLAVNGNSASNSTLGAGLLLEALFGVGGATRLNGPVNYNQFSANLTNLRLRTTNNSFSVADLTAAFVGNVITNARGDNVVCDVTAPSAFPNRNCDPNFGDFLAGGGGGRNTIQGSAGFEMVLDPDMQNALKAENNFWGLTSSAAILQQISISGSAPFPSVFPFLFTLLSARISPQEISAQSAESMTVTAGLNSRFVDNPDRDAAVCQMIVTVQEVGSSSSTLVDPITAADGSLFSFVSPLLPSGNYRVNVVLPGGQTASVVFSVDSSGGGGGTASCVVASAAHGDYDAPEVRVLRRLRDDYFLTNELGRAATAAYYRHGPPLAGFISAHDWARGATRAALAPVVTVAGALLRWNAGQRFAAGALCLGLLWWLRRRR